MWCIQQGERSIWFKNSLRYIQSLLRYIQSSLRYIQSSLKSIQNSQKYIQNQPHTTKQKADPNQILVLLSVSTQSCQWLFETANPELTPDWYTAYPEWIDTELEQTPVSEADLDNNDSKHWVCSNLQTCQSWYFIKCF